MKLSQKSGEQAQCMLYFFSLAKQGFQGFQIWHWHGILWWQRPTKTKTKSKTCFKHPTTKKNLKTGASNIYQIWPKISTNKFRPKTSHQFNDEFAQFAFSSLFYYSFNFSWWSNTIIWHFHFQIQLPGDDGDFPSGEDQPWQFHSWTVHDQLRAIRKTARQLE